MFSIWLLEISSSFQGTKTSRSWIKRLWCSGHTGTTKASTSTKLLNFTTKLLKLSWRNPPKSPARWVSRWVLPVEGGEPEKTLKPWSCDAVCGLSSLKALFPWLEKYLRKPQMSFCFSHLRKKTKNRTSSGWQLDGRESSKISFFQPPKKGQNWQSIQTLALSSLNRNAF